MLVINSLLNNSKFYNFLFLDKANWQFFLINNKNFSLWWNSVLLFPIIFNLFNVWKKKQTKFKKHHFFFFKKNKPTLKHLKTHTPSLIHLEKFFTPTLIKLVGQPFWKKIEANTYAYNNLRLKSKKKQKKKQFFKKTKIFKKQILKKRKFLLVFKERVFKLKQNILTGRKRKERLEKLVHWIRPYAFLFYSKSLRKNPTTFSQFLLKKGKRFLRFKKRIKKFNKKFLIKNINKKKTIFMARSTVIQFLKKNLFVKKQIKKFSPFLSKKLKKVTRKRPFLKKLIHFNYKMLFKSTLQLNNDNLLTKSIVYYRIKQLKKHNIRRKWWPRRRNLVLTHLLTNHYYVTKNPFFYTNKFHNILKLKPLFLKKKKKRFKKIVKKHFKKKNVSFNLIKKFGKNSFNKKFLFSIFTNVFKFRNYKKKNSFSIFTNVFLKKPKLNFFNKNLWQKKKIKSFFFYNFKKIFIPTQVNSFKNTSLIPMSFFLNFKYKFFLKKKSRWFNIPSFHNLNFILPMYGFYLLTSSLKFFSNKPLSFMTYKYSFIYMSDFKRLVLKKVNKFFYYNYKFFSNPKWWGKYDFDFTPNNLSTSSLLGFTSKAYKEAEVWQHNLISKVRKNKFKKIYVKRIKFKPGYSRMWRHARVGLKFLMNVKFQYQHRLTYYIFKFFRLNRLLFLKYHELNLTNFLTALLFLPDRENSTLLITNKFVFVNGLLAQNENLYLVKSDFLQLIISIKYYVLFKWLKNFTFKKKQRLNKFIYSISKIHLHKDRKKLRLSYPVWTLSTFLFKYDIPRYVEVDYLSLSAFILYEPYLIKDFNQSLSILDRSLIYNLYNWKYIT